MSGTKLIVLTLLFAPIFTEVAEQAGLRFRHYNGMTGKFYLPDASENFRIALAIDELNPAAHYGLGQVAMARRSYAEAVKHFEKTLAVLPGATRGHYSLAMAYRGLGETEKARAHLARQGSVGVRVSDPLVDGFQELVQGERLFLSRGKLAFEAQRYADAVVEFRKAAAAKPDSGTARVNLGALVAMALAEAGRCNEAFEWQRQVIAAAEQQGKTDLLPKLRDSLKLYEGVQTCRPPADSLLAELLFFERSR